MSRFLEAAKLAAQTGRPVVEVLQRAIDESDFHAEFKLERSDAAKRQVFGWAYQTKKPNGETIVDLNRGFTSTEVLEEGAYEFVLVCRSMGEQHQKEAGTDQYVLRGRLIESMMFTREKCEALGIPAGLLPEGWWVGFYVDDDKTWAAIERGDLRDLSVAAIAHSTYLES